MIDNASHDGSHTRAVAAHPWARLIENPTNVFLSPAWNQGIRETKAPWVLLLNPDIEWWAGTLADYVAVAKAHPDAGIVGPLVRNSDGTIYESGRPFPDVVDAAGHAFLGTVKPDNPLHEALPPRRVGPAFGTRGGLGLRVLHAGAARGLRSRGHARRGVPALR